MRVGDPDLGRWPLGAGPARETFGVGAVSTVERALADGDDVVRAAVVDLGRRHQPELDVTLALKLYAVAEGPAD